MDLKSTGTGLIRLRIGLLESSGECGIQPQGSISYRASYSHFTFDLPFSLALNTSHLPPSLPFFHLSLYTPKPTQFLSLYIIYCVCF